MSDKTQASAQPLTPKQVEAVRAWLADPEHVREPDFIAGRPLSRLLATIDALNAELHLLREGHESEMLDVINERDHWEAELGRLAAVAGCSEEWSSSHEHGACIQDSIEVLREGRRKLLEPDEKIADPLVLAYEEWREATGPGRIAGKKGAQAAAQAAFERAE